MAHGDAGDRKWRGNWRMEWVASTLHTTSEHGVSSIITAAAHTSVVSRLNWRSCRFKWTHPFRRKTKSCFCACAITFQTQSTSFAGNLILLGSEDPKNNWWSTKTEQLQQEFFSSPSAPHILLITLFLNIMSLCSSLKVGQQVSHPDEQETSYNLVGFSIYVLKTVKGKAKNYGPNGSCSFPSTIRS